MRNIKLINLDFLNKNGWCIVDISSIRLEELTQFLIEKFPLDNKISTSILHPKLSLTTTEGKNPTFSSTCGYDSFPFHTDTAFEKTPVRFLIMKAIHPSNTATTFFSFSDFYKCLNSYEKENIKNAIFSIKSTEGSYYNRLFLDENDKYIRFDPLIMTPQNSSAKYVFEILKDIPFQNKLTDKIFWNGSNILIIDNWRILHRREKVDQLEYDSRKIQRIYVG